MQTDQLTNSTTVIRAHDGPALQAIFINNGQKVLSCGEDHRICKWDTNNQKLEAEFLSHDGPVYELGCNATQDFFYSLSEDGTVRLWNLITNQLVEKFSRPDRGFFTACFSPDGEKILLGARDGTVEVFDVYTQQQIITFEINSDWYRFAYLPDNSRIAFVKINSNEKKINVEFFHSSRFFPISNIQIDQETEDDELIVRLTFSPKGDYLVFGTKFLYSDYTGVIRLLDIETGSVTKKIKPSNTSAYDGMVFSENGQKLFIPTPPYDAWTSSSRWKHNSQVPNLYQIGWIINSKTGGTINPLCSEGDFIKCAKFVRSDRFILTGSDQSGDLCVWNAFSGNLVKRLKGHSDCVMWIDFCERSGKALTASWDGTLRIWNLNQ